MRSWVLGFGRAGGTRRMPELLYSCEWPIRENRRSPPVHPVRLWMRAVPTTQERRSGRTSHAHDGLLRL